MTNEDVNSAFLHRSKGFEDDLLATCAKEPERYQHMIYRNVILTAEHHNFGLSCIYDWQQTKYILFEDGTLISLVFEGASIRAYEGCITEDKLRFICDNAKAFVSNAEETAGWDGEAWQFEGPDYSFPLGYIYGTELEKIAEILMEED